MMCKPWHRLHSHAILTPFSRCAPLCARLSHHISHTSRIHLVHISQFAKWDDGGDGRVGADEFHLALTQLGLSCGKAEADELFASWDADGPGHLDSRNDSRDDSKNAHGLRKDGPQATYSRLLGNAPMDLESGVPLDEQLASVLDAKRSRVKDLFVEWDQVRASGLGPGAGLV